MKHEPIDIPKMDKISELLKKSKTDDGTFLDALYNLYVFIGMTKGTEDIRNGRYWTLEELKQERKEKYEAYTRRLGKRMSR